jgi:hypothetical protein
MDTNKDNNKDNLQKAAEQWVNLVMMLIKMKRQQQAVAKKIKDNDYDHR